MLELAAAAPPSHRGEVFDERRVHLGRKQRAGVAQDLQLVEHARAEAECPGSLLELLELLESAPRGEAQQRPTAGR